MGKGIQGLDQAYHIFFTAMLIVLAVLLILCLIRAIIGPRVADRIVSVNMMGTMVIVIIAVLALMLGEGYLADICVIYALISFLAVIVLTKVYLGVYLDKKASAEEAAQMKGSGGTEKYGGVWVRGESGDIEEMSGPEALTGKRVRENGLFYAAGRGAAPVATETGKAEAGEAGTGGTETKEAGTKGTETREAGTEETETGETGTGGTETERGKRDGSN